MSFVYPLIIGIFEKFQVVKYKVIKYDPINQNVTTVTTDMKEIPLNGLISGLGDKD